MKKELIEHFETSYDRSIYDIDQLRINLSKKLASIKSKANESQDIFVEYTDKYGTKWQARSWQELQDSYACDLISSKKFDKLAETLEKKQEYLKKPTVIYQLEQEIKLLESIIRSIKESKERRWPLC